MRAPPSGPFLESDVSGYRDLVLAVLLGFSRGVALGGLPAAEVAVGAAAGEDCTVGVVAGIGDGSAGRDGKAVGMGEVGAVVGGVRVLGAVGETIAVAGGRVAVTWAAGTAAVTAGPSAVVADAEAGAASTGVGLAFRSIARVGGGAVDGSGVAGVSVGTGRAVGVLDEDGVGDNTNVTAAWRVPVTAAPAVDEGVGNAMVG